MSNDIVVDNKVVGRIEVCYLEERPKRYEGPFLKEERALIKAIAKELEEVVERTRAKEKLVSYQKQLRSLASRMSLAEAKERRRIAGELHDYIGQSLSTCKMKLGALKKTANCSGIAEPVDEIRGIVDQVIDDIRSLIFEVSPPILYEFGLEAALEWLCEQMQMKHGIMSDFESDNTQKLLDDDVKVILFQIVRELLTNVAKHAYSSNVKVSIWRQGDKVRINVADDGIGFDTCETALHSNGIRGFGLFSIRERLTYVGGHIEIQSRPGKGTTAIIEAPLTSRGKTSVRDSRELKNPNSR
jgi:signal transduction histidine kinase